MAAPVPRPDLHDAALRHLRRRRRPDLPGHRAGGGRRMTWTRVAGPAGRTPRRRRPAPHPDPARPRRRARRPGRQRLPRAVPRPGGRRGRGRGRAAVGRRSRCVPAGHRHARPARRARARAGDATPGSRPRSSRAAGTPPTSPWSPRSSTASAWSSPTRTSTPRSSTPPGSRAPRSRSCRTPTSTPYAARSRRADGRRALVLAESVYSVLGDEGPLVELADVCAEHGALLVVDEAHGLGVHGPGVVHRLGLAGLPHVVVTLTLSKALGSQGGAVLGPPELVDHLVNTARPFIFDTALAPAGRRGGAGRARRPARPPGARRRWSGPGSTTSPPASASTRPQGAVVSLPMPSPQAAVAAQAAARAQGVLVGCFRPPVGPRRRVPAADHGQRRRPRRRLGPGRDRPRRGGQGARVRVVARHRDLDRCRQDGRHRRARGHAHPGSVVVVKPVQTGAADGDSDAPRGRPADRRRGRRSGPTLDEPLAPDTAARRQGVDDPDRRVVRRADRRPPPRHRDRRGRRRAAGAARHRRRHAARPRGRAWRRTGRRSRWWSSWPPGWARSTTPS